MTLLLTWVVPDGIVMGADSALTWPGPDGKPLMTLSDAYKIVPYDRGALHFGVSFGGLARISGQWAAHWLQNYVSTCPSPTNLVSFATHLASELNDLQRLDQQLNSELLGLQVAGWEVHGQTVKDIEPRFLEVSNLDRKSGQSIS